jgi:type I restriction enzyme S subunit
MIAGWKPYKLSDVFEIIGGGTPKTDVEEYWNGDIPWLSVVDFNNDQRTVSVTEKSITELGLQNSSTKILRKGQLIISARGTVGQIAQLGRDMAFNQSCYGLTGKHSLLFNDFGYYLLKHTVGRIKAKSHGSVFDTITRSTFDSIEINLPPLPEQRAIASILSALDDKIELNLKTNKTLEDIAMTLYKHWFVDFGPFRDGDFIPSELGEIPKGWEVKRLPEIYINHNKKRAPISTEKRAGIQGVYPYYGATKILDFINDFKFEGEFILLAEDGTVKTERDTPFLQYVEGQFWVSNHAHVLTGNKFYSTEFLYVSLANTNVLPIITGAVQLKINKENLETLKFIVGPEKIMRAFDDLIIPIYKQIKAIERENQTLTTLRDTLLPKLISGEVRVKEAALQVTEAL